MCNRITQEKELLEKHNLWLDEELKVKVKNLAELRKTNMDEEARMSARIAELEREISESCSSLWRGKECISELEQRVSYMEKELCSTKDAATANEQRLGAELSTVWFYLKSLSSCCCNVCVCFPLLVLPLFVYLTAAWCLEILPLVSCSVLIYSPF
ncbi:nuclear-pore anchor [Setaria viridis]|uniref:nuclear-pore anchor n=1 Tax=Setaria viridis TaxID=4556 RepID=UPI003B3A79C3